MLAPTLAETRGPLAGPTLGALVAVVAALLAALAWVEARTPNLSIVFCAPWRGGSNAAAARPDRHHHHPCSSASCMSQHVLGLARPPPGLLFPPSTGLSVGGSLAGPRVAAAIGESAATMAGGLGAIAAGVLACAR